MSQPAVPPLNAPGLRRRLLAWYRRNARDLPWRRRTDDPYAVWLSEVMLQQTQASTVIPYYEKFLERFPTVADLAHAERSEVLRLWAGLGYYRRAHQMHETAQRVAREHDGCFPNSVAELLTLPGVGRYTAGAVASIAFDRRAPVLDGNVKRVLARLTASPADPDSPAELARLWQLAEDLLPRRACGEFNQALMELGATICTPRTPRCAQCPLAKTCTANLLGCAAEIPPPRRRATVQPLALTCLVVRARDSVLVGLRPAHGLWAGTWTPPATESNGESIQHLAARVLPAAVRSRCSDFDGIGAIAHRLTHREVTISVYGCRCPRIRLRSGFRWLDEAHVLNLPTAFRRVLALVR